MCSGVHRLALHVHWWIVSSEVQKLPDWPYHVVDYGRCVCSEVHRLALHVLWWIMAGVCVVRYTDCPTCTLVDFGRCVCSEVHRLALHVHWWIVSSEVHKLPDWPYHVVDYGRCVCRRVHRLPDWPYMYSGGLWQVCVEGYTDWPCMYSVAGL